MDTQLLTGLTQFGALGVLVFFLMWQQHCAERSRKLEDEKRMAYDRDRLTCDKEMTAVLATLCATIQAKWQ